MKEKKLQKIKINKKTGIAVKTVIPVFIISIFNFYHFFLKSPPSKFIASSTMLPSLSASRKFVSIPIRSPFDPPRRLEAMEVRLEIQSASRFCSFLFFPRNSRTKGASILIRFVVELISSPLLLLTEFIIFSFLSPNI